MLAVVLYLALVVSLASTQDYDYVDTCPETNGFFADALQCDRYYECKDGEVSEHFCDDGLVFDESSTAFAKCSYPFATDCTGRPQLQEAQSTLGCPRKHGYFPDPDPTVCDKFSFCVDGIANPITCPGGLIFDPSAGQCAWSDQVNRPGCTSEDFFKFTCPDNEGAVHEHPRYPDPEDCQFFYICIGGTNARRNGCGAPPMVFNEVSLSCEDQRKVEGRCSNWFNETYLESIGPKPTPSPRQQIALENRRKTLNPRRGAPRRQSIQPRVPEFPPEQIPQVLADLAGFGQNEPFRNAAPSIDNRPFERPPLRAPIETDNRQFERPPQRAPIETDNRQFERPPQRAPVVNTNRVRGRAQSSRPNVNSFESSQTGLRTQPQETRAPVRTRSRTRVGIPRRRTTQAPVTEAPRFGSEEKLNFLNDLRGSISDSQNTIVQATPKATFTRPPRRRGNTGRRQPTLRPVPAVPKQIEEQSLPFLDSSSQGTRSSTQSEASTGFGRRRRPPGSRTQAQQSGRQPEQEQSTRSRVSAPTAVDLGPSDLQALVNSVRGPPPPATQESQFTQFTRTQPEQESFSSQRRAPVSRGRPPPQSFREEEESFSSRRAPVSRGGPPPQSFREEEESLSSRRAPVSRGGPPPQSLREEEESFSSRRAPVSRGGGFGGRRPVADTTEPNEPLGPPSRGRLEVTRLNSLPALNNFEEDESEFAQFRAAQASRSRQRNGK